MKTLKRIIAYIWLWIVILLVLFFEDTEKEEYLNKEDWRQW